MKGWKLVLGIVLGALLLTGISWAQEEIQPECWRFPLYICANSHGQVRLANFRTSFQTREWVPVCRANEVLIKTWQEGEVIEKGDQYQND